MVTHTMYSSHEKLPTSLPVQSIRITDAKRRCALAHEQILPPQSMMDSGSVCATVWNSRWTHLVGIEEEGILKAGDMTMKKLVY